MTTEKTADLATRQAEYDALVAEIKAKRPPNCSGDETMRMIREAWAKKTGTPLQEYRGFTVPPSAAPVVAKAGRRVASATPEASTLEQAAAAAAADE